MNITLVNPPTLFRWQQPSVADAIAVHKPYFDVLLRNDHRRLPSSEGRSSLPGEHLGIGAVAGALRSHGHEVRIVDGAVSRHDRLQTTIAEVLSEPSDLIGFTTTADIHGEVRFIAEQLRWHGFDGIIMVGNDHATLNDRRLLECESSINVVVRGDGELVAPELVSALQQSRSLQEVDGLTWRGANGQVIRNPPAQTVSLDTLPKPARDTARQVLEIGMSLGMFTKRGCPFRCAFCTKGVRIDGVTASGPSTWRHKSPLASATEFIELAEQFSARHITITDDLFTGRDRRTLDWVCEFATALIDAGNTTSFMIDTRADGIERELFSLLRRAGLQRVFVGVESGSDYSLAGLNKRLRRRTALAAMETLKALEIEVLVGFMFFTPLADRQALLENTTFLQEIEVDDFGLHVQRVRIYPGTGLEELLRRRNLLTGSFPHFTSAFADAEVAAFYPVVHRLADHVLSVVGPRMPLQRHHAKAMFVEFNKAVHRALLRPQMNERLAEQWFVEESQHLTEWMVWHL